MNTKQTLQDIYYTIEDSYYDTDEYMYYNYPDVNIGKMDTISQQEVEAVTKKIYGTFEFPSSYIEIANLSGRETGNDEIEGLMDYMLTREDKQ